MSSGAESGLGAGQEVGMGDKMWEEVTGAEKKGGKAETTRKGPEITSVTLLWKTAAATNFRKAIGMSSEGQGHLGMGRGGCHPCVAGGEGTKDWRR